MAVNIAANLIALAVLPATHVVAGLAAGFGAANLVGAVAGWWILSRRIGGLDGRRIGVSLVKMHVAAIPCVLFAAAVTVMIGAVVPAGTLAALITVMLSGSGALLLYVLLRQGVRRRRADRSHLRPAHPPGPVGRVLAGHRVRDR